MSPLRTRTGTAASTDCPGSFVLFRFLSSCRLRVTSSAHHHQRHGFEVTPTTHDLFRWQHHHHWMEPRSLRSYILGITFDAEQSTLGRHLLRCRARMLRATCTQQSQLGRHLPRRNNHHHRMESRFSRCTIPGATFDAEFFQAKISVAIHLATQMIHHRDSLPLVTPKSLPLLQSSLSALRTAGSLHWPD